MRRREYHVATNQWTLVPEVLKAINAGHNTLDLLMAYFPFSELLTYCNEHQRPYTMLAKLLRDMREAGAVDYNKGTRKWKTKIQVAGAASSASILPSKIVRPLSRNSTTTS
jgi:hypothetical protein